MVANRGIAEFESADPHGLLAVHSSWERVRLSDTTEVVCGYPYQSRHFGTSAGVPIIRIRDIRRGYTETFYNGPAKGRIWVEPGDLIVGMDGVFHCAVWNGESALLNQRVCKLIPDARYYSKVFLSHILPAYLCVLHSRNASLTVKHLSLRSLAGLRLPLPPRAEQDRIASRLDGLMAHISTGEEILSGAHNRIGEFRRATIEGAVSGLSSVGFRRRSRKGSESGSGLLQRVLSLRREVWENSERAWQPGARRGRYRRADELEAKDPGRLPPGWVWATLGQLCWSANTGTGAVCSRVGNGQAVLRVLNIRHGEVRFDDLKYTDDPLSLLKGHLIGCGDFLVVRSNGNATLTGTGALVREAPDSPTYFTSYVMRFRIVPIAPLAEWINIAWQSLSVRKIVAGHISASTGHFNVSQSRVLRVPLPIPPLAEQAFLVRKVKAALCEAATACESLARSTARISPLRHAILGEAVRGRLVAQDRLDEPARELLHRLERTRRPSRGIRQPCDFDFSSPLGGTQVVTQ